LTLTGSAVRLDGDIYLGLTTPILLAAANLDNLGSTPETIYGQLAKIHGGVVNATAQNLEIIDGTYDTTITTTGTVTLKGVTTFNAPLNVGTPSVVVSDAAPVSVTLNEDSTFTGGLTHTSAGGLTIKGSGKLTLTGALAAANAIAFEDKEVVLGNAATHTFGGKLTVGDRASVTLNNSGGKIVFGPGDYTPTGDVTFNVASNNAVITLPATADAALVLGQSPTVTTNLTLKNTDTTAVRTFTATTGIITLSGKGNGAILVAQNSTLTPGSADVDIALGDGALAFGSSGRLATTAAYTVSGFTAHRGPGAPLIVQTTGNDWTTFVDAAKKYGTYGSGITVGGGTYTWGPFPALTDNPQGVLTTAGSGNVFEGLAGGGIVTKNSDIIE
jgi:hypothetical protein